MNKNKSPCMHTCNFYVRTYYVRVCSYDRATSQVLAIKLLPILFESIMSSNGLEWRFISLLLDMSECTTVVTFWQILLGTGCTGLSDGSM